MDRPSQPGASSPNGPALDRASEPGASRRRTARELADALRESDERYVRVHFVPLDGVCGARAGEVRALIAAGRMPEPAYWLDDGTELVPPGYLDLLDDAGGPERLPDRFRERYLAAGGPDPDGAWRDYLSGAYQMCVRDPTPERIARKDVLPEEIDALLRRPLPDDPDWRAALRPRVAELDRLELPFAPLDRLRLGARPSRERLIDDPQARWPEVFAD